MNFADNGLPKATLAQSTQVPPWAQYMHNFQGPPFQQFSPYQGYFYPGMQVPQSYFPGNGPWPSSTEDSSLGHHADDNRKSKSFSKNKEKVSNRRRERRSRHSDSNEPDHSSSASDSEDYEDDGRRHSSDQLPKKSGKNSSRKVVIRNINYITSNRSGERESNSEVDSSDEDGFIDADSLKQQVDEALGSFDRRHKSTSGKSRKRDGIRKNSNELDGLADRDTENTSTTKAEGEKGTQGWDVFQNLLMKDAEADSRATDLSQSTGEYQEYMNNKISGEEKLSSFNVEAEDVPKNRGVATDAFLLDKRSVADEGIPNTANFEAGENVRAVIKRGSTDEELLLSQKVVGSETYSQAPLSNWGTESSIIKSQREEDWFVGNQPDISGDPTMFNGDDTLAYSAERLQIKESNKDVLVDDSFMIQGAPVGGTSIAEQKTDIFLEADIAGANQYDNNRPDDSQDKVKASNGYEPDDLYMVLGRDSAAEQVAASWNPEMDYNDNSIAEAVKKHSDELNDSIDVKQLQNGKSTNTATGRSPGGKVPNHQVKSTTMAGTLGRSKSELLSKARNTPSRSKTMAHRSKVDQVTNKHQI